MEFFTPQFWVAVGQIVLIDLLLSGDNAVVIALACRSLPQNQRKLGILLGAGTAVGLRILFALLIASLLVIPFLKVVGALLLLWIAVKLVVGDDDVHEVEASTNLWRAVRTVAIADAVMSLDNVIAIVGASHGNNALFIFGLLLSIPLIIYGSQMLMAVIHRFPIIVWAGAALLGWIAGEMLLSDPVVLRWLQANQAGAVVPYPNDPAGVGLKASALWNYAAASLGAALVVALGFVLARRAGRGAAKTV